MPYERDGRLRPMAGDSVYNVSRRVEGIQPNGTITDINRECTVVYANGDVDSVEWHDFNYYYWGFGGLWVLEEYADYTIESINWYIIQKKVPTPL